MPASSLPALPGAPPNSDARLGEDSMPWRRRIAHTLEGASLTPIVASSPWIRRYPHIGFSFARRRITETVPTGIDGRPSRRCEQVHFRRTRSRCHRSKVSGWTRNRPRRAGDRSRLSPARTALSTGRSAGRATCLRKTATSWRSMTTSKARSCCSFHESRTSWSERTNAM